MFKFFQDKAILFLAPIMAYFLGWIYLGDYFATLSVPRRDLGVTLYDIYLYAFAPFLSMAQTWSWSGAWFVLSAVAFSIAFATQRDASSVRRKLITLAMLIASIATAYMFAAERGRADAREILRGCGGRLVNVALNSGAAINDPLFATANMENRLRFIWQTETYVYVVPVASDTECQSERAYDDMLIHGNPFPTFQIARKDVHFLRLLDPNVRRRT